MRTSVPITLILLLLASSPAMSSCSSTTNPPSPDEEVSDFEGIEVYWNRKEVGVLHHLTLHWRVRPWLHKQGVHIFSDFKTGPLTALIGTHKDWSYRFEPWDFCTQLKEEFSRYEIHCNHYIPIDPVHPDGPV